MDIIKTTIEKYKDDFKIILPQTVAAEKFARCAISAIKSNSRNLEAFKTPTGRAGAAREILRAAHDGLFLDGREAALLTYKGDFSYQPMYQGLIKLARKSGEVARIDDPKIVYEGEHFIYKTGLETVLEHEPSADGCHGEMIGAYAVAKLINGEYAVVYMSKQDIDKRRLCSTAGNSPWKGWFEEMVKKTVLRKLCNILPGASNVVEIFDRDPSMQVDFKKATQIRKRSVFIEDLSSQDDDEQEITEDTNQENQG